MPKKKDLKVTVEKQLSDMLDSKEEPSEGRMKLLALGIKMLAVNAKLEESEFGSYFVDNDERAVDTQPAKKPNGSPRIPAKET